MQKTVCLGTESREPGTDLFLGEPEIVLVVFVKDYGLRCPAILENASYLLLLTGRNGTIAAPHFIIVALTKETGYFCCGKTYFSMRHLGQRIAETAGHRNGLGRFEGWAMAVRGGEERIGDGEYRPLHIGIDGIPRHAAQTLCSLRTILAVAEGKGLWKFHSVRFK